MFRQVFVLLLLGLPLQAADPSTAALIEGGHYKRAQAILSDRLKANTNDARSLCEMSKVSEAFAHWDDAIAQAEKAQALDRKNPEFQAALADAVGSKLSASQGGMFEKLSLARRFKREIDLALQLDPNNLEANEDLMEFHLDAPGLVGGDKKKASELADRVIRINAVRGYLMKFQIATHEKKPAEQEQFLQQAISADPENFYAREQAANYFLNKGGPALVQAEEHAKRAIHIDAQRIGGYVTLATIYAQESRWKELDAVIADSKRNVPDDLAPLYQAAKSILVGGQNQDLPRAEKYLQTYLSQPPE